MNRTVFLWYVYVFIIYYYFVCKIRVCQFSSAILTTGGNLY